MDGHTAPGEMTDEKRKQVVRLAGDCLVAQGDSAGVEAGGKFGPETNAEPQRQGLRISLENVAKGCSAFNIG